MDNEHQHPGSLPQNRMPELIAIELKAHLPSKDFSVSKQFYQDIGFTLCWSNDGLALLHYGPHGIHGGPAFLLQNYYVKEFRREPSDAPAREGCGRLVGTDSGPSVPGHHSI